MSARGTRLGLRERIASAREEACQCGHVSSLHTESGDCGAWQCPCQVVRAVVETREDRLYEVLRALYPERRDVG